MTDSLQHWRLERDAAGIAWLCLDKAGTSTNVLSREVLTELGLLLDELERDQPAGVVLCSGKDKGFVAGADINEFPNLADEERAIREDPGRRTTELLRAAFDRVTAGGD